MEINFNINDMVRVKLTEYGEKILRENHEKLNEFLKSRGGKGLPEYKLRLDEDGYYKTQLWILMAEFGNYMRTGRNPMDTRILFEIDSTRNSPNILEQKREAFMNALSTLDYDKGVTIGSYVGELEMQNSELQNVLGFYSDRHEYHYNKKISKEGLFIKGEVLKDEGRQARNLLNIIKEGPNAK